MCAAPCIARVKQYISVQLGKHIHKESELFSHPSSGGACAARSKQRNASHPRRRPKQLAPRPCPRDASAGQTDQLWSRPTVTSSTQTRAALLVLLARAQARSRRSGTRGGSRRPTRHTSGGAAPRGAAAVRRRLGLRNRKRSVSSSLAVRLRPSAQSHHSPPVSASRQLSAAASGEICLVGRRRRVMSAGSSTVECSVSVRIVYLVERAREDHDGNIDAGQDGRRNRLARVPGHEAVKVVRRVPSPVCAVQVANQPPAAGLMKRVSADRLTTLLVRAAENCSSLDVPLRASKVIVICTSGEGQLGTHCDGAAARDDSGTD